jgi:hypothetical protein
MHRPCQLHPGEGQTRAPWTRRLSCPRERRRATDSGVPGLREAPEGVEPSRYYAAFVLDPDGNNIEAVF